VTEVSGSRRASAGWRATVAGPAVALAILVVALVCTREAGLPVRDPDHVAALYLVLVGFGVVCLVGLDVLIRAARSAGSFPPPRAELARVRRERWTRGRCLAAGSALVGFYVSYMAYRNLKSIVPLLRPDVNFDRELAEFDRGMFAGHDPAALLHDMLGTGLTTHVLSAAYVAFIVFLPLTIGASLVFSRDLRAGLVYTTAQSINWLLGAGSYFLLPSLGPIYHDPGAFSELPASEVTRLQGVLLDQRIAFLHDPAGSTPQAIAAFVSLHISMSFTAAVAAHLMGAGRRLKIALWTWLAVTTVGTVYLGWHYFVDDVAGVALGAMALALAAALSGVNLRGVRRRRPAGRVGARAPVPAAEQGALLTRGDSA
jgi:membrane-associated phospholipid phosphatase